MGVQREREFSLGHGVSREQERSLTGDKTARRFAALKAAFEWKPCPGRQPKAGLKRNSLPETPQAGGMQQGRVAGPFAKLRWTENGTFVVQRTACA